MEVAEKRHPRIKELIETHGTEQPRVLAPVLNCCSQAQYVYIFVGLPASLRTGAGGSSASALGMVSSLIFGGRCGTV